MTYEEEACYTQSAPDRVVATSQPTQLSVEEARRELFGDKRPNETLLNRQVDALIAAVRAETLAGRPSLFDRVSIYEEGFAAGRDVSEAVVAVERDEAVARAEAAEAELATLQHNYDLVAGVLSVGGQLDQLQAEKAAAEARAAELTAALTAYHAAAHAVITTYDALVLAVHTASHRYVDSRAAEGEGDA